MISIEFQAYKHNLVFIVLEDDPNASRKRIYKTIESTDCIYFNLTKDSQDYISSVLAGLDAKVFAFIPSGKFLSKANQTRLLEYASIDKDFWGWFKYTKENQSHFTLIAKRYDFLESGMFLTSKIYYAIGGLEIISFKSFRNLYGKLNARLVPQKTNISLVYKNRSIL
ncbi:MAG: hypothetical protein ACO397_04460 [Gammaproteobacteria bacterium]